MAGRGFPHRGRLCLETRQEGLVAVGCREGGRGDLPQEAQLEDVTVVAHGDPVDPYAAVSLHRHQAHIGELEQDLSTGVREMPS